MYFPSQGSLPLPLPNHVLSLDAESDWHVPGVPEALQLPSDLPFGGRLQEYWKVWQDLGAEKWVVSVLRNGYRIPFKGQPPPLTTHPKLYQTYIGNVVKAAAMEEEISKLLAKGAVEPVDMATPGFYSLLFLQPSQMFSLSSL